MSDDKKQMVGVETDKSIADVIRALLLKPATELGTIFGDGIGLLSDRVREKRQRNLEHAMQKARTQIEALGLALTDITPLDEMDVHKIITGMSLSSDEKIQNLWAGLLASALDPRTTQTIERSITTVIEALSPQDAKVLNFLVFAELEEQFKQDRAEGYLSKIVTLSKDKESRSKNSEKINELNAELNEVKTYHSQRIVSLARQYGIMFTRAFSKNQVWHLNVARLGLIELSDSTWSSFSSLRSHTADPLTAGSLETVSKALEDLAKRLPARSDDVYLIEDGKWHVSLGVKLSPFGREFARACGIFSQPLDYFFTGTD